MKIKPITLVAIALILLCMAPSFLVSMTRSDFTQCNSTEYNAWADGDDDGDVDIFDVVYVATKYGTNGCATKSLNITNWPTYFWPPYPNEMNITNWPLDNNGNLKVNSTIDLQVNLEPMALNTSLATNRDLAWPEGHLYEQDVKGYERVTIACKAEITCQLRIEIYWVIGGVEWLYNSLDILPGEQGEIVVYTVNFEKVMIWVANTNLNYDPATYSLGLYATT